MSDLSEFWENRIAGVRDADVFVGPADGALPPALVFTHNNTTWVVLADFFDGPHSGISLALHCFVEEMELPLPEVLRHIVISEINTTHPGS